MEWQAQGVFEDGAARIRFRPAAKAEFGALVKANGPIRLIVTHELPESKNLRRFYHGAVLPLWAFLDGADYRSHQVREDYHELAKLEFNGAILFVKGEERKIGRTSKGRNLGPFVERVIDYLEENYGIDRTQVLDPDDYKYFISAIYMHGKYDTYIDFLVAEGRLKTNNTQ